MTILSVVVLYVKIKIEEKKKEKEKTHLNFESKMDETKFVRNLVDLLDHPEDTIESDVHTLFFVNLYTSPSRQKDCLDIHPRYKTTSTVESYLEDLSSNLS